MAIGRQNVSVLNTGMADQTPSLVRNISEEEQVAVQEKIEAYKAAGLKVPDSLSSQAKTTRTAKHEGPGELHDLGALTDVPQPMEPGTVERGTPLSPTPDTVPEPEDGSAPDKRAQDNRPVGDPVVRGPKDPGPEFTRTRRLPDQPQPGEPVKSFSAAENTALDAAQEMIDRAGPAVGDETQEEAEARRADANRQVPADDVEPRPTQLERVQAATADLPEAIAEAVDEADQEEEPKRRPAKKAAAKKATSRRGR